MASTNRRMTAVYPRTVGPVNADRFQAKCAVPHGDVQVIGADVVTRSLIYVHGSATKPSPTVARRLGYWRAICYNRLVELVDESSASATRAAS